MNASPARDDGPGRDLPEWRDEHRMGIADAKSGW